MPNTKIFRRAAVVVCVLCAGIASLTGCQRNVFPEDQPRSQYDRFDTVRDQRAQQFVYDEYGYRKPNLRGRLLTGE
jgi:uncharacterized membrane protein